MLRRRFTHLLLFLVCSAGMVAAEDVTVTPRIGETELKTLRERFQALQGRKLDPSLLESLAKLAKDNPKAKPEDLAKKLLAERPDLANEKTLDSLREFMRQTKPPGVNPSPPANPFNTPDKSNGRPATETPETTSKTAPKIRPDTTGPKLEQKSTDGQTSDEPKQKQYEKLPESKIPRDPPNNLLKTFPPKSTDRPKVEPKATEADGLPVPVEKQTIPKLPTTTDAGNANALPQPGPPPGNAREYQAAAQWWEKNFGPLKDSPAMQDLLTEFLKGQPGQSKSPFAKLLEGSKLPDVGNGGVPKSLGLDGLKLGGVMPDLPGAPTTPSAPNLPSLGGFSGDFSLPGIWILVVGGLAGVSFLVYKLLKMQGFLQGEPKPPVGLGPWPLDPRSIRSRDDLVKAFEYLSVLTIGGPARHFHHNTIAAELDRLVPDAGTLPDEVAAFYASARYAPTGADMTGEDIAAARAALCRLAGVKP